MHKAVKQLMHQCLHMVWQDKGEHAHFGEHSRKGKHSNQDGHSRKGEHQNKGQHPHSMSQPPFEKPADKATSEATAQ